MTRGEGRSFVSTVTGQSLLENLRGAPVTGYGEAGLLVQNVFDTGKLLGDQDTAAHINRDGAFGVQATALRKIVTQIFRRDFKGNGVINGEVHIGAPPHHLYGVGFQH